MGNSYKAKFFQKDVAVTSIKELKEVGVDFSSFHNELNKCGNIKFWEDTCVNFFGEKFVCIANRV